MATLVELGLLSQGFEYWVKRSKVPRRYTLRSSAGYVDRPVEGQEIIEVSDIKVIVYGQREDDILLDFHGAVKYLEYELRENTPAYVWALRRHYRESHSVAFCFEWFLLTCSDVIKLQCIVAAFKALEEG